MSNTLCHMPHPDDVGIRCGARSDALHANHFANVHGRPVQWPNPDYVAPPQRFVGARQKDDHLRRLVAETRDARCGVRSVDSNVIAIGARHPRTSITAARRALPRSGSKRRQVYDHLLDLGPAGATDDEMEVVLDRTHQSLSASRNTLMNDGYVCDSGRTRLTREGNEAIVWVLIEFYEAPTPAPLAP